MTFSIFHLLILMFRVMSVDPTAENLAYIRKTKDKKMYGSELISKNNLIKACGNATLHYNPH